MKENVKVEQGVGFIPQPKSVYWYIRSCIQTHRLKVIECEWIGGMSDLFRLAKGNVYLDKEDAEHLCYQINCRLEMLAKACEDAHQKEFLERIRKKVEDVERKRIRDEEKKKSLSQKERAVQYENRKRKNKSPHPDIIV